MNSLAKLARDLEPFLIPIINKVTTSRSSGATSSPPSSDYVTSSFITVSNTSNLDYERSLSGGDGLTLTDNGANSTIEIDVGVSGLGLSVDGTNVILTSSSDVSAGTAAILASDASGNLVLNALGIETSPGSYQLNVAGSIHFTNGIRSPSGQSIRSTGSNGGIIFVDYGYLQIRDADASNAGGGLIVGSTNRFSIDRTNSHVGIGTLGAYASYMLQVRDTSAPQFRLEYNGTYFSDFTISSGGNLQIEPVGNLLFETGDSSNQIDPITNYKENLGQLSKKYLTLHAAELWVETLVAQETIATIGGRILVGPTTTLEQDLSLTPDNPVVYTKHNQMRRNDITYMEANAHVEFFRIGALAITAVNTSTDVFTIAGDWTAYFGADDVFNVDESTGNDGDWTVSSSTYTGGNTEITVTGDITDATVDGYIGWSQEDGAGSYRYLYVDARNLDGSGKNDWYAGDAMFNTGQAGDGFIDLYSYSGVVSSTVGPTIVGNVRNSLTYNDWTTRWAIGNLNGLYGKSSDTYGSAFGDYSSGNYLIAEASGISLHGGNDAILIDDSGISLLDGSGTINKVRWVDESSNQNMALYANESSLLNGSLVLEQGSASKDTYLTIESQTTGSLSRLTLSASRGINPDIDIVLNTGTGGNYMHFDVADTVIATLNSTGLLISYGLTVGGSTSPPSGSILCLGGIHVGGTSDPGVDNLVVDGYTTVAGELRQGGTDYGAYGIQTTGQMYANGYGLFLGGIHVGGTSDPGDDHLIVDGGVYVGSAGTPTADDITYDGNLVSRKSSVSRDVYGYAPIGNPYYASSNNNLNGTTGLSSTAGSKTLVDISSDFSLPADAASAKAFALSVLIRDSGAASNDCVLYLGQDTTLYEDMSFACIKANDVYARHFAIVTTNGTNGDFYYQVVASGTGTFDLIIRVIGMFV